MVRRDWFDCNADEVNQRYIEYLGANNTFSDQYGSRVTVERFANIVYPLYEAKKVDLKNDGVKNYNLKVANYFNEILNSAYDEVANAIEDHLEDVATEEQGKTIINQSLDKTGGTFLTHLLTYNLAENLLGTDVAVALHQPDELRQATTLSRNYGDDKLSIALETDLVIFKPSDPSAPSIHFSMKSSMKERSHIVTMWALLRDIAQDPELRNKYDIEIDDPKNMLQNVIYNFATADLAGDFDDDPRNLIKMDMSFVDYAFLARSDVAGAKSSVDRNDEHMQYHMDAIYDLISKVYDIEFDQFGEAYFELSEDGITRSADVTEFDDN